jgi:hypothetical protein
MKLLPLFFTAMLSFMRFANLKEIHYTLTSIQTKIYKSTEMLPFIFRSGVTRSTSLQQRSGKNTEQNYGKISTSTPLTKLEKRTNSEK